MYNKCKFSAWDKPAMKVTSLFDRKILTMNMIKKIMRAVVVALILIALSNIAVARDYLLLQTTSSVEDSGLLRYILPKFTKETGIKVKAVSLGSGLALAAAARGEADVAITHSPKLEKEYESKGLFSNRQRLFWNDFIVVGPPALAPQFAKSKNVEEAFKAIEKNKILFFSRGDNSGTYNKELEIWSKVGLDPKKFDSAWYKLLGQPMGKTLQSAIAVNAVTLSDLATFSKSNVRDYVILFKSRAIDDKTPDKLLKNDYSIILISSKKFPQLEHEKAQKFFDWMYNKDQTAPGQTLARAYRIKGKQVFFQY